MLPAGLPSCRNEIRHVGGRGYRLLADLDDDIASLDTWLPPLHLSRDAPQRDSAAGGRETHFESAAAFKKFRIEGFGNRLKTAPATLDVDGPNRSFRPLNGCGFHQA